jgi:hypothetical protein
MLRDFSLFGLMQWMALVEKGRSYTLYKIKSGGGIDERFTFD